MALPILYRDDDYVVVSKPAGLMVHRSYLDRGADEFALQTVRDQIGQHVFPVHRLDRPTSGALVFALSGEAARELSLEFSARRVVKTYWAVVRGVLRDQLIEHPLRVGHEAVTGARCLASVELPFAVDRYPTSRYSLVEARPLTGRLHQIRRHLRHVGHPIVGDVTHGVGKHNRFFAAQFGVRRLLLASVAVAFRHPRTGAAVSIRAPLCREFSRALEALGWAGHAQA